MAKEPATEWEKLETLVRGICDSQLNDCGCMRDSQIEALTLLHSERAKAREILVMALARGINQEFAEELKRQLDELT